MLLLPGYHGGLDYFDSSGFSKLHLSGAAHVILTMGNVRQEYGGMASFFSSWKDRASWNSTADDNIAYLRAAVGAASRIVKHDGVYLIGKSDGSTMAHRCACAMLEIRGIATISGTVLADKAGTAPLGCLRRPLNVLAIHGDDDMVSPYDGGPPSEGLGRLFRQFRVHGRFLSASQSVRFWAVRANGCAEHVVASTPSRIPPVGPYMATEQRYSCPRGSAALWTVHGAGHLYKSGEEKALSHKGIKNSGFTEENALAVLRTILSNLTSTAASRAGARR